MEKFIAERERRIKVSDTTDVLVAGGGTAGVIAAIAAAKSGSGVLLVEQFGALGGSAANSLVTPLMSVGIENNPDCSSISREINGRMEEWGYSAACGGVIYFDPEVLKCVLEEMCSEAGVKLLYYTFIADVITEEGRVKGVVVENKGGRSAILARRVIDCTGDGDICAKAGVPFEKGNPQTGKNQDMSVRYMMAGINLDRFAGFLKTLDNDFTYCKPFFHMATIWGYDWAVLPVFQKACEAGDITYEDGVYWQVFGVPGRNDALAFNCPEICGGVDGTNPRDLTDAQVYAKKAVMRMTKFYKKYFPGFENAYVSSIAPMVGVRESRRIRCRYTLADEDVLSYRKFEDAIAKCNYPVDVHSRDVNGESFKRINPDGLPYYEIPYRCIVPVGVSGLLTAGRCISASFIAQSSLRIQQTVRALGEAAGIAAAMSIGRGVDPHEIHGKNIREEMIKRGAGF